mmetsp:Transcript_82104/g.227694  ORF Transcript_82104/g.227694 Transcript_82104/m.227694 type:complete len:475 (-) Transcript_82104:96-1520(-)
MATSQMVVAVPPGGIVWAGTGKGIAARGTAQQLPSPVASSARYRAANPPYGAVLAAASVATPSAATAPRVSFLKDAAGRGTESPAPRGPPSVSSPGHGNARLAAARTTAGVIMPRHATVADAGWQAAWSSAPLQPPMQPFSACSSTPPATTKSGSLTVGLPLAGQPPLGALPMAQDQRAWSPCRARVLLGAHGSNVQVQPEHCEGNGSSSLTTLPGTDTLVDSNASSTEKDAEDGETIEVLRTEIGTLRSELEALRGLLDGGLQHPAAVGGEGIAQEDAVSRAQEREGAEPTDTVECQQDACSSIAPQSGCWDPGRESPRMTGSVERMDSIDGMWCAVLRRFPRQPHWTLLKESRGVYRMGGQAGRKLLCRVSHGGLQVRVGGGWMGAVPFLEKYGPSCMGPRPGEDKLQGHNGCGAVGAREHLSSLVDIPASMERLLVPTKCWAQKIGISKSPDLREQRRLAIPSGSLQTARG